MWTRPSLAPNDNTDVILKSEGVAVDEPNQSAPNVSNIKDFVLTATNFSFSPAEIKVKVGDTVRIKFANAEGFHDFKLDEFNVATKQIQTGISETVEFVASKAGSFQYYCSVGQHRVMGMVGSLIVE